MAGQLDQPFASFEQAVHYLFSQTDYERMARVRYHKGAFDLARMRRLCELLGRPQDGFASLHIAGTKGKGSVAAMTAWMLAGGGRRTGLYISPHLADLRERISIIERGQGGATATRQAEATVCQGSRAGDPGVHLISRDDFTGTMNKVAPALEAMAADPPTFFELMTAIGFVHFGRSGVDIAVLETGLGGRLDATNVVTPRAVAITPVGIEHTAQLGDTIEQIAGEKAGIIKPGVPVVSAPQRPGAEQVIRRVARDRLAPLWFVGQDIRVESRRLDDTRPARWEIVVRTPGRSFGPLVVPLLGRYQTVNLAVALGLLDRVIEAGFRIDLEGAWAGLARTQWPGRLEIVARRPWVVLDGAHTEDSIRAVVSALPETFDYDHLIVVLGCLKDKNPNGIVGPLASAAAAAVLTRSDHPHSADPEQLADTFARLGPLVGRHVEPDAPAALKTALALARPNDLVLVTGSIYLVGLVRQALGAMFLTPADRAPVR